MRTLLSIFIFLFTIGISARQISITKKDTTVLQLNLNQNITEETLSLKTGIYKLIIIGELPIKQSIHIIFNHEYELFLPINTVRTFSESPSISYQKDFFLILKIGPKLKYQLL